MAAADLDAPRAPKAVVVLIVDDEVLIRMLLSDVLRQAGYQVIEAANADEAVVLLNSSPDPDILVTDVRMPGTTDGFALAAFVRRTKPDLKVIITSGHAGPNGAIDLADAFLPKPYPLDSIVRHVRMLTEDL